MSERRTVYNVLVPEKYIGSDKVERTNYYNVGTAFHTKNGDGLRVKLAPNITVSGEFMIFERKAKDTTGGNLSDDEIPF